MKSIRILTMVVSLFVFSNAEAFEMRLFEKNEPVENYNQLVTDLRDYFRGPESKPVDLLFDSAPEKIVIDGYLGEGSQAIIFSSGDYAIRLPLNKMRARESTDNYFNAWSILNTGKYSYEYLPQVFHYVKREYVLVGREKILMDYSQFTNQYDHCRASESGDSEITFECNYCEMLKKNEELLQLVHDLSEFDQIGDAHKHNVVYIRDKKGVERWMVLDFAPEVVRFSEMTDRRKSWRVSRFDAFQYNYETVNRNGRNPYLDLQYAMNKVVEHSRTESCSRKHDSFIEFDPLFIRLKLLCKRWNTLYQR